MISSLTCLCLSFVVCRILFLFFTRGRKMGANRSIPTRTLIIIGSGGHTSEMLRLLTPINRKLYSPRIYVLAQSDSSSAVQISAAENSFTESLIVKIPRSRAVNQSYFSSVLTTVVSTFYCFPLMLKHRPSLILCNGPGTCVPICLIAFFLNIFYINPAHIVFVESICRVDTLSLTGKILYWFANSMIVQWPQLAQQYKRCIYLGRLV